MRCLLGVLMVLVVIWSCAEKPKRALLQEKEIALAQPRIISTSAIIDSSVTVTANLRLDGVEIFYTNDGEDPTIESTKYNEPFELNLEGTYKFKAFHPLWKPSETTVLKLYKKGVVPSKIKWDTNPSSSYIGMGQSTLINQEKASLDFRNPHWVGFDSIAVAEVYFEKKTLIESINIGYLIDTQSWIFPPASIRVSSKEIDAIQVELSRLTQHEPRALRNHQVKIGKELSSVRIEVINLMEIPDWHDGKGTKAWLFMDEWIFK